MLSDHDHPENVAPPDCTMLGTDPEPIGTERFQTLTEATPRPRRRAVPSICPLSAAFGGRAPCSRGACLFFSVPGVTSPCAVDQWSPRARRDRELAAWYIARRVEAAGGMRPDDPVAIPLHTLATPGPGD